MDAMEEAIKYVWACFRGFSDSKLIEEMHNKFRDWVSVGGCASKRPKVLVVPPFC